MLICIKKVVFKDTKQVLLSAPRKVMPVKELADTAFKSLKSGFVKTVLGTLERRALSQWIPVIFYFLASSPGLVRVCAKWKSDVRTAILHGKLWSKHRRGSRSSTVHRQGVNLFAKYDQIRSILIKLIVDIKHGSQQEMKHDQQWQIWQDGRL